VSEDKDDGGVKWPLAIGSSIGVLVASGGAIKALQGGSWNDLISGLIAGVACIVIGAFISAATTRRK
jgi:uncharacterized membrane protein